MLPESMQNFIRKQNVIPLIVSYCRIISEHFEIWFDVKNKYKCNFSQDKSCSTEQQRLNRLLGSSISLPHRKHFPVKHYADDILFYLVTKFNETDECFMISWCKYNTDHDQQRKETHPHVVKVKLGVVLPVDLIGV